MPVDNEPNHSYIVLYKQNNQTLSEKRAKIVADALKDKGIAPDRIVTDFKGDTVQPFRVPEENRVSVCIAE